jgi:hypothetical protein
MHPGGDPGASTLAAIDAAWHGRALLHEHHADKR